MSYIFSSFVFREEASLKMKYGTYARQFGEISWQIWQAR
ncbi:unnamed protein product [Callosobruchus maculatus]|uniref:Uncharacterized protein n=1 Tax=Callosobruchus maculatus TaxID=64391 RepID=A0A653DEA2_CALMS|nr:unnamed protein product [Callosobruchus maculatus]VEN58354.1 unnamed protein product [Callosobruchus maculatus]